MFNHASVQTNKFQIEHVSGTELYLSVLCTLFQVGVHAPDLHVRSLHSHHEVSERSHVDLSAKVCIPSGHNEENSFIPRCLGPDLLRKESYRTRRDDVV